MIQIIREWIGVIMTRTDLLSFALIGLVAGLVFRDKTSRIFVYPIIGIIGAIPGALFLKWANLFPYCEFVGAFFGALVFVGVKRGFSSDSS